MKSSHEFVRLLLLVVSLLAATNALAQESVPRQPPTEILKID